MLHDNGKLLQDKVKEYMLWNTEKLKRHKLRKDAWGQGDKDAKEQLRKMKPRDKEKIRQDKEKMLQGKEKLLRDRSYGTRINRCYRTMRKVWSGSRKR